MYTGSENDFQVFFEEIKFLWYVAMFFFVCDKVLILAILYRIELKGFLFTANRKLFDYAVKELKAIKSSLNNIDFLAGEFLEEYKKKDLKINTDKAISVDIESPVLLPISGKNRDFPINNKMNQFKLTKFFNSGELFNREFLRNFLSEPEIYEYEYICRGNDFLLKQKKGGDFLGFEDNDLKMLYFIPNPKFKYDYTHKPFFSGEACEDPGLIKLKRAGAAKFLEEGTYIFESPCVVGEVHKTKNFRYDVNTI